ncbi:hypothetical protein ACU40O_13495 [Staphylococcus arlettae]
MTTAELSYNEREEIRIARSNDVLKQFQDYLEFRRYPKLKLIARDSGVPYVSISRFVNEKATLSNKSLDKLEVFMKNN